MKKVKTIFLVITVVAILALGVGLFMKYFNPSTKNIARFCLHYEGKTITDTADVTFPRRVVTVQAKHVFEFAESDTSFTVKIVPNPKADFAFSVGGTNYRFADVEDLTPAFNVTVSKEGFTIDLTKNIEPKGVLEKLFLGAVTMPQELKKDNHFFTLVATSANGKSVTINFNTEPGPVTGIELPGNEEVFYF